MFAPGWGLSVCTGYGTTLVALSQLVVLEEMNSVAFMNFCNCVIKYLQ